MFRPLGLVVLAEVATERFPSPVAVDGVGDGREGRHGLVFARVLQELSIALAVSSAAVLAFRCRNVVGEEIVPYQSQSPVPAHTMPEDADPRCVDLLEGVGDRRGELGGDVAVHVVALGPGFPGRVDVEASAGAEIVGVVFARDSEAAWEVRVSPTKGYVQCCWWRCLCMGLL